MTAIPADAMFASICGFQASVVDRGTEGAIISDELRITNTMTSDARKLRARTRRAVVALERRFGIPARGQPRPLLDSLVQTILSQSTSDVNSHRAFAALKERFPAWEAAWRAGPGAIEAAIRSGGLARQKSRRIHKLLGWARDRFGDFDLSPLAEMPTEEVFATLLPLEGVGVKTVAVMLLFACGRDCFAVDTHVHRIVRRLGLVPHAATAEKTFHLMARLVPAGKAFSFHVNLLRLGRTLCRPTKPNCPECPLKRLCDYHNERRGEAP